MIITDTTNESVMEAEITAEGGFIKIRINNWRITPEFALIVAATIRTVAETCQRHSG